VKSDVGFFYESLLWFGYVLSVSPHTKFYVLETQSPRCIMVLELLTVEDWTNHNLDS
jgi:hypothetical protein